MKPWCHGVVMDLWLLNANSKIRGIGPCPLSRKRRTDFCEKLKNKGNILNRCKWSHHADEHVVHGW